MCRMVTTLDRGVVVVVYGGWVQFWVSLHLLHRLVPGRSSAAANATGTRDGSDADGRKDPESEGIQAGPDGGANPLIRSTVERGHGVATTANPTRLPVQSRGRRTKNEKPGRGCLDAETLSGRDFRAFFLPGNLSTGYQNGLNRPKREQTETMAKRRASSGGEIVVDFGKANPKQLEFFEATEPRICYGGAKGGGKTWAVRVKALLGCMVGYPGIRILMLACFWWAVDEDGRCWCYRELEEKNLIVSDAAAKILSCTLPSEKIAVTYAPPDMWARQKVTEKTMAEVFTVSGVPLLRSDNNRVQGHMLMLEMMAPIPLRDPFVKALWKDGKAPATLPGLMFFDTLHKAISDIKSIQADEKNPNDCAKQPHEITHTVDGVRYFCISRVQAAEAQRPAEDEDDDETLSYESYVCGGDAPAAYIGIGA